MSMMTTKLNRLTETASRTWAAFLSPEMPDERRAAKNVWDQLPDGLKTDKQALGRHSAGCAATYGVMEACDFYCTACYLSDEANHTPPLPFSEVKKQLDMIREYLGPWGNAQITAGEVTLLPCDDLIEIIRYARQIELSPMLMTNGQTILKDPSYLHRLMREAGLDKVAIHIDTTEKGRLGLKNKDTEADIHWIRDAFANLIRQARLRTGLPLSASHTFTVTESNFADIPDVMRWLVENADAFRMLSLQPTAEVGRTRTDAQIGKSELIWNQVYEGLGARINPAPFHFGHPDCNQVSLSFVVTWIDGAGARRREVVDVVRPDDPKDEAFFRSLLNEGFAGFSPDGEPGAVVLARIFGRIKRHPKFAVDIPGFVARRGLESLPWMQDLLRAVLAGRAWSVKPLVVVMHNFMSAHELDTEVGQERLAACAFRVPVDGRMVSMCELNGTELRTDLNRNDQKRLVNIGDKRKKPARRPALASAQHAG